MVTWFIVLVFASALLGGVVSALLGWVSTTEPFCARKFITSVIKALIGAVVITVAFDFSGTTAIILLLAAFLSGAGVDAGVKRVTNAITAPPPCDETNKPS